MSNVQKTPLSRTLSAFTKQKALDEIAQLGLGTPGSVESVSGAMVTVNFEVAGLTLPQVTIPLGYPEYIRLPIQKGDKGLAVPASFFLGGISGFGTAADDTQPGNLGALWWIPIGSKNFSPVDPNAVTVYGPNGVVLRDSNLQTVFALTPSGIAVTSASGSISLSAGGHAIVINSTGVIIDGRVFLLHEHVPGTFNVEGTPVVGASGGVV